MERKTWHLENWQFYYNIKMVSFEIMYSAVLSPHLKQIMFHSTYFACYMGITLEFFAFSRWQISTGNLFNKHTLKKKETVSAEKSTKKGIEWVKLGFFIVAQSVMWDTYTSPWRWSQMTPCHAINPSVKKIFPCLPLTPSQWYGGENLKGKSGKKKKKELS